MRQSVSVRHTDRSDSYRHTIVQYQRFALYCLYYALSNSTKSAYIRGASTHSDKAGSSPQKQHVATYDDTLMPAQGRAPLRHRQSKASNYFQSQQDRGPYQFGMFPQPACHGTVQSTRRHGATIRATDCTAHSVCKNRSVLRQNTGVVFVADGHAVAGYCLSRCRELLRSRMEHQFWCRGAKDHHTEEPNLFGHTKHYLRNPLFGAALKFQSSSAPVVVPACACCAELRLHRLSTHVRYYCTVL